MDNFLGNVNLTVDVAENGHTFEGTFPATALIELVQQWLESRASVPCHDQLLLCDEVRLEPHRSLASYKLPALGCRVLLFSRSRLMPDAPPPPPEQILVQEPIFPPPPLASLSGYPSDGAYDPAAKVLRLYERHFLFHHEKGLAYFGSSQDILEVCKRLHREQLVQNVALSTAKKNMDHYHKIIDESYTEFRKCYSNQYKRHSDILTNFERDLERLRACKLHPSLLTENQKTLVDCVNVTSLRQQAEACANSHKQFHGKVLQLNTTYAALQQDVKEMLYTVSSVDFKRLERMIADSACILEEESSIVQSLRKDVDTVKKLVDDDTCGHRSNSLCHRDAVSAFRPMFDVHDKDHLPRMETCCHKLRRVLEHFRAKKHEMCLCVHRCMKRIASLQSRVRDMRNQLSAFKEASSRQDETFAELKVVQKVGSAYRACLAEVIRRKSDMKLYMGQAGQLAERMAKIRDSEVARRGEFLRVQSRFIPRDMLASMGLLGVPSQCSVGVEPYDADLLDIDMKDLEKYSPTVILGSHLQCSTGKGERTTHASESSNADTQSMGDSIVSTSINIDLEVVESELSEEVSGTSKLEVENAWLKAELASVIALLCNIDPDFAAVVSEGDQSREGLAAQKTMQALALKDEHASHLKNLLKTSQIQSSSYQKRICELEKRLLDQYNGLQKLSLDGADRHLRLQVEDVEAIHNHSVITGDDMLNSSVAFDSMGYGVCSSQPMGFRQHPLSNDSSADEQRGHLRDGDDETMSDPSCRSHGGHVVVIDTQGDKQVLLVAGEIQPKRALSDFMAGQKPSTSADEENSYEGFPLEGLETKEEELATLRAMVLQKGKECTAVEERLQVALDNVDCLRAKLQENGGLLDECQINCAELENSLHVAREEARTNQCSADRKAAEYSSLRTSSVKLRGLVERFRQAVLSTPVGTTDFVGSIHLFAKSLGSAAGDDGTKEFCMCARALAERVDWLAQQQFGLLKRCTSIEASKAQLAAEVSTKTDLLKIQIAKRKADKQTYRERICYTRFHVHELAIFSPNTFGHYEAINRSCPNYYLSAESLALFLENLPSCQQYIIGQIVHIERRVARLTLEGGFMAAGLNKPSKNVDASTADIGHRLNPYDVPVGTEYFVVTLAVVPDLMPSAVTQCSVGSV